MDVAERVSAVLLCLEEAVGVVYGLLFVVVSRLGK
jgi:hypothetical protein